MRSQSPAARLGVERLESRECPACIVYKAGGTVHVLGDGAANTIVIRETGPIPPFIPGGLSITADGVSTGFPAGSVLRLVVQTRGGDDVVTYTSSAAAGENGIASLALDLGTGDDVADVTVSRNTLAPADFVGTWNLTVSGSSGDDAVVTRFGRIDFHSIRIRANLGAGNDTFAALFGGPIAQAPGTPAVIRLNVQGGAGDDAMDLEALTQAELSDLTATFLGGEGDDDVTMAVGLSGNTPSRIRLEAMAGAGNDLVSVSLAGSTPAGAFRDSVVISGGSGADDLAFDGNGEPACDAVIDGGVGYDVCSLGSLSADVRHCELVT